MKEGRTVPFAFLASIKNIFFQHNNKNIAPLLLVRVMPSSKLENKM